MTNKLVEAIVLAAMDEGMCADLAEQFRPRVEALLAESEECADGSDFPDSEC